MELSIQERLKDLRVERGLTLEQLAEQTHLSKSALGSYEGDKFKDISHYALIELAKFYEVTVDYLLGRSQTKNHPNADLADLRLSDDMIELLKSGLVDNSLLCELATHPDFPRLMADLEIYVNGVAGKHVQSGCKEKSHRKAAQDGEKSCKNCQTQRSDQGRRVYTKIFNVLKGRNSIILHFCRL